MNDDFQRMLTLTKFEDIRHTNANYTEYWIARELQTLLDYKTWQRFDGVIDDAIAVCAREGDGAVEKKL